MRYRLRTLLILLAVGPPLLAWAGWIAREFYLSEIAAPPLFFRPMRILPPFIRPAKDSN
jgi:hypothetical protein